MNFVICLAQLHTLDAMRTSNLPITRVNRKQRERLKKLNDANTILLKGIPYLTQETSASNEGML